MRRSASVFAPLTRPAVSSSVAASGIAFPRLLPIFFPLRPSSSGDWLSSPGVPGSRARRCRQARHRERGHGRPGRELSPAASLVRRSTRQRFSEGDGHAVSEEDRGGTGRPGGSAATRRRARTQGHDVVPISRSLGVDLITGEGLAEALGGVEFVIDAASQPLPDQAAATAFFTTSARNLQQVGEEAGLQRIVRDLDRRGRPVHRRLHRSEVRARAGVARRGRSRRKSCEPRSSTSSSRRWWSGAGRATRSTCRGFGHSSWRPGASPKPSPDSSTISGRTQKFNGAPISEIGGPREERLVEVARLVVSRRDDPLPVEEVSNPADPDHELLENGALLPGADAIVAGPTFEEWLDTQA